jgi:hypothetical protein
MLNLGIAMIQKDLLWIINWYNKQCLGKWEHGGRVQIGTVDNPGWFLLVNLQGTSLENCLLEKIKIDRTEHDWAYTYLEEGFFKGYGGPLNLPEIFHRFRNWAEKANNSKQP